MTPEGKAKSAGLAAIDSTMPSPSAQMPGAPVATPQQNLPTAAEAWKQSDEFVKQGRHRPTPDFADHVGKPVPKPKSRGKRIALIVGGSILGVLALCAILTLAFWGVIARSLITSAAEARGLSIKPKSVSLGPSSASLDDIDGTLPKVKGVKLHADKMSAELSFFTPLSVSIEELEVDADNPQALAAFVSAMSTNGGGNDVPLKVEHVHVHVKQLAPTLPIALNFDIDHLTHKGKKTELVGVTTPIPIVGGTLGPFDLAMSKNASGIELSTPSLTWVKFLVDSAGKSLTAKVDPLPIELMRTFSADGKNAPSLGGTLTFNLEGGDNGPLGGAISAELTNAALPLPVVGAVSQGPVQFTGEAELSMTGATLKNLKLQQGVLSATGAGKITWQNGGHAEIDLEGAAPSIPGLSVGLALLGAPSKLKVHFAIGAPTWIPDIKMEVQ